MTLAAYACDPAQSRGRRFVEPAATSRTAFQRDRDRIVHCSAFRRLVYKTQVFLNHEGDLFRTRLTHSLEVAQLARSIARALQLNEDLVEAIALAHDLGHTPFGHAGQDALNACMAPYGGFEHNLQSLRVVDQLEQRYPDFDGLNLCFESREGILKHCSRANAQALERAEPGGVGSRFLQRTQPSLEAQLCNLADEIAYNAHDVDDGVRSRLITLEQLRGVALFERFYRESVLAHPRLLDQGQGRRLLYQIIRRMLNAMVDDVTVAARASLAQQVPSDVDAVRRQGPILKFSPDMEPLCLELKKFLLDNLYRHPQVQRTTAQARQVVHELFQAYRSAPHEMQSTTAVGLQQASGPSDERVLADYIAGMTDRFASREHHRLTGQNLLEDRP